MKEKCVPIQINTGPGYFLSVIFGARALKFVNVSRDKLLTRSYKKNFFFQILIISLEGFIVEL